MAINYKYNSQDMALEDDDGYFRTEMNPNRYGYNSAAGITQQSAIVAAAAAASVAAVGTSSSVLGGKVTDVGLSNSVRLVRPDTSAGLGFIDISASTTTTYLTARAGNLGNGGNANQGLTLETPGIGGIRLANNGLVDLCGGSANYLRVTGGANGTQTKISAIAINDADCDIVMVPKGGGSLFTGWGYMYVYSILRPNIAATTATVLNMEMTKTNSFSASSATWTNNNTFTNTSARTCRYIVNHNMAPITVPAAGTNIEAYINQNSTRYGQVILTSDGTKPMQFNGTSVIELASGASFNYTVYGTNAFQPGWTSISSAAAISLIIQQIC